MSLLAYKIIIIGLIIGAFFSFMLTSDEGALGATFFMFFYLLVSIICVGAIFLFLHILGLN